MNTFIIENEINDGLIREGWQDENGRYHNKLINKANGEAIMHSDEPDGFLTKRSCERNANLVVSMEKYLEAVNGLDEAINKLGAIRIAMGGDDV